MMRIIKKMESYVAFKSENVHYDSAQDELCDSNKSSVENSIQYLQQELQMLGLPCVLSKESKQPETSRMINVVYHLLRLHRHNIRAIDELKDSLQRQKSDAVFHGETQSRLKDELKSYQRELARLKDQERQLNDKIKVSTTKLRTEQEEVRRLKLSIQYKQTQRAHESKKREKEYERLKQKLGQLVSDKNQERRVGLNVLNTVQRTDGKRRTWTKPGSGDVEMYQIIVSNYEERQKELMVENASVRESLYNMQKQLLSLLSEQPAVLQPESDIADNQGSCTALHCNPTDQALLSSGHFQMPYDIVRDGIEENFKEKCKLVKECIDGLKMRIEELKKYQAENDIAKEQKFELKQVDCNHQHIDSDNKDLSPQNKPLMFKLSDQESTILSESFVWKEQTKLQTERELFLEQNMDFEKEKQKFMEAVCRLDRERQVFEDEKAAFLREQLLDVSFLSSTKDLDSFFSSTPSQSVVASRTKIVKEVEPAKSSINDVDLQHDLSLCSDDGIHVLNERPTMDLQEELSDQD